MDISEILNELIKLSKIAVIVVEGKRDKEALNKLEIENVITIAEKRLTNLADIPEDSLRVIGFVQ